MKHLKFGWIFLLGIVISLASCDTNNVNPEFVDDESALLDLLFFATAEDSTNNFRGPHGKCNLTEVAIDDLPSAITDYITTNYPGSTIHRAGLNEEKGVYMVGIEKEDGSKAGLIFDLEGNFLEEKKGHDRGTPVAPEDLPAAITDYVAANYAGATIHKAFQNPEGRYGVIIQFEDNSHTGLGFDADGNFLGELKMRGKKRGKR